MKILLFICFTLFFLGTQSAFSGGSVEDYKSFIRGRCIALRLDCDLSLIPSCWNEIATTQFFSFLYEGSSSFININPEQVVKNLEIAYSQLEKKDVSALVNAIDCEKELSYARLINKKVNFNLQNISDFMLNERSYASANPNSLIYLMRNMPPLLEQRNFEAVGLLDGIELLHISEFKLKTSTDIERKAWNDRYLFMKGLCESLGVNCPMDSMTSCWTEETSAAYLQFFYGWIKACATSTPENGVNKILEYLSGQGKERQAQIPESTIECDKQSTDYKLIHQKLGFDIWSQDWFGALIDYPKELPESYWHYKISQYQMVENKDMEGAGMTVGLAWYHISEWKKGRLVKKTIVMNDL